jgi:hypothetical protein
MTKQFLNLNGLDTGLVPISTYPTGHPFFITMVVVAHPPPHSINNLQPS